ncbi:hypothetical protein TTHERM_00321610 (macronuclear) [Tetrahymena thermophila SB210]|uniref:Uncharacterized protein n=1 Tax=Tetrahymena thermophila (strain SB210) TaxID=312017 RepID=Q237M5_TETTS|nr:hypothetical protein TTHERM_00321610 [Tetrahymena thermophila SB210]EAR92716.1 hypothetical protein TTHERM_00321610 [Tetrahymena thermophila SB210]|eukprot:XP_001012961.1 hypothetical protein TTHERM_00321610 [Tetrahymena thermophila SB210]
MYYLILAIELFHIIKIESYESSLYEYRINRINSRSTDSQDEENEMKEQMNA